MSEYYCEVCGEFISDNIDMCYYHTLSDKILCYECYVQIPKEDDK